MRIKKTGPKLIRLCGVQGCCPTVEIGRNRVVLKDDFGGQVRLTRKQWRELGQVAQKQAK